MDNRLNHYPIVKIIYDRRKKTASSIEGSIEIEIKFHSKRKWISTGVKVIPSHWDNEYSKIVGRIDSQNLNMRIYHKFSQIEKYINQLILDDQPFSWNDFNLFLENKTAAKNFLGFVERMVNNRNDIGEGTRKNHQKFHRALVEFNSILNFEDITKANILKYDAWLHQRKKCKQSTIASYHKLMKIYVNEALRRDLISKNPYDGIKIESGKSTKRKFLTEDEIIKIEECKPTTKSLEKVKDLFIFQLYTGLSYTDLREINRNNIVNRNGKMVILDQRQKTGEDYYIVLLPQALKVLEKYDYSLPLMSLEQYNMRLKIIADTAKVDKNLTSHMARHTYATLCLNKGVKIEILAKMLGHADIRTTQIYAKLVNSTVESAYEELEQKLRKNSN